MQLTKHNRFSGRAAIGILDGDKRITFFIVFPYCNHAFVDVTPELMRRKVILMPRDKFIYIRVDALGHERNCLFLVSSRVTMSCWAGRSSLPWWSSAPLGTRPPSCCGTPSCRRVKGQGRPCWLPSSSSKTRSERGAIATLMQLIYCTSFIHYVQ